MTCRAPQPAWPCRRHCGGVLPDRRRIVRRKYGRSTKPYVRAWYKHEHCHGGNGHVARTQREAGVDRAILAQGHELYQAAHTRAQRRRSREACTWTLVGPGPIDPQRDAHVSNMRSDTRSDALPAG